jgi:membrane associated rhomboid family serine protease/Tfp pilus assembly protein PilF
MQLTESSSMTVATWAVLALNAMVFAVMVMSGVSPSEPTAEALLRFGANRGVVVVANNEWWRPLFAMFIHVGFLHLAVNMFSLAQIAPAVERMFGQVFFAACYLFSGLIGSLTSNAVHPLTVSAGASGALFGLLGCLLAFTFFAGNQVNEMAKQAMRRSLFLSLGINLMYGFANPQLDNACHIGGFVGGFACGAWLTWSRARERAWLTAATLVGLVGVVLLAGVATAMIVAREPWVAWQRQLDAVERAQNLTDGPKKLEALDEALKDMPAAIKDSPEVMTELWSMRAEALMNAGRYEEAEAEYQRCLVEDDSPMLRNNLAWAQLQQDKLAAALENANRSIEQTPSETAYGTRCFIYAALQDTELALSDCRAATQKSSNSYDAGMLAFLEKRYDVALKEWAKASRTQVVRSHFAPQ